MNYATPIISSESLKPLAECYMRIELIEWIRSSGITLVDLLSSYALARKGTREEAAIFLREMGFHSMAWDEGFKKWLIEFPPQERIPAAMEFDYIELLGSIIKAHYQNK